MLKVSELAKELGVSVQTIYRALNSVKQNETASLTDKIKGVSYFTELGERAVRECLSPVKQNNQNESAMLNYVKQFENDEIIFLREQNKTLLHELEQERKHNRSALDREREHSRQQAERIADLAEKLTELTRNSQVLLKQEQDKNPSLLSTDLLSTEQSQSSLEDIIKPPKNGMFKRFFSKK